MTDDMKLRESLKQSVKNGEIEEQDIVCLIDDYGDRNLWCIACEIIDDLDDDDVLRIADSWGIDYEIIPKEKPKLKGKK